MLRSLLCASTVLLLTGAVAAAANENSNAAIATQVFGNREKTWELRWAFMPTFNAFRAVVLNPPENATRWEMRLSSNLSAALLNTTGGAMALINNTIGFNWFVQELTAPAEYTLDLVCFDSSGNSVKSDQHTFIRARRPFEDDDGIGRTAISKRHPIPPFLDMIASNYTQLNAHIPKTNPGNSRRAVSISVVGREYSLTTVGLWRDVRITTSNPEPRDGCFCRSGELGVGYKPCDASTGLPRRRDCPNAVHFLQRPMELVATDVNGVQHIALGNDNDTFIHESSPTNAEVLTRRWQAGPLSGSTRALYDYDGCAKVWLTLDACKQPACAVRQLQLRVPIHLDEAPFMHTVTDYLREHYSGTITPGEGETWNSSAERRFTLPGPYLPYIWVGGSPRGIALFSDNDQGWISAEPAYSIERNSTEGTVTLIAHLISANAPGRRLGASSWDKSRVITLGMMASPAKPQPSHPATSSRRWWPDSAYINDRRPAFHDDSVTTSLLGNSMYWGTHANDLGFYPLVGLKPNYTIFDALTYVRANPQGFDLNVGSWMNETLVPAWASDCAKYKDKCPTCEPAWSCSYKLKQDQSSIQLAFNAVRNAAMAERTRFVIPYTNPQSILWNDDTAQFMDEWTQFDIADPLAWGLKSDSNAPWFFPGSAAAGFRRFVPTGAGSAAYHYAIGQLNGSAYYRDPVDSYATMALHAERKMLSWADGVYYDNVFLNRNAQPAPFGPGYVDDDGQLRSGTNVWAWREFMKRTAVMQHEMGKRETMIWAHMTNVNMISHLSWATISSFSGERDRYDWEWRDNGGLERQDVQTRNQVGCDEHGVCRDTSFILAQTSGEQAGTIPIAIDSGLRGPNCTQRPDLPSGPACIQWLTRTHYATCLAHEVRPQGFCGGPGIPASPDGAFEAVQPHCNVSSIMLEFGYGDIYCDHYRFWEDLDTVLRVTATPIFNSSSPSFQGNATMILPLLIRCPVQPREQCFPNCPGRVMAIFSSFGPAALLNFELNRTALKLRDAATAFDAETHVQIPRTQGMCAGGHCVQTNNFSTRLDRHNFRVVIIE